eukprot:CAMPEP_0183703140 /NCGR_PEP_ID=MMETSP0737-20130205/994_1 /TAXON_ID=385413 /ORGANISM="Thalassiosira miniscula, Strain CCMP1093" /LENGTH=347 /DNA_ID=CAMNT_0025929849 /DNA_START=326 /DNA_END=1369 /DNA_ORIENTATION=-
MNLLLNKCKDDLEEKGFTHIPGHQFYALLLHFGAAPADLDRLEEGNVHKHVMRDREESMSFRQISMHRVLLNEIIAEAEEEEDEEDDASSVGLGLSNHSLSSSQAALPTRRRLSLDLAGTESVTNLSTKEIASETGGVKRSGIRKWNLPPFEYVESTVPEAIARILDFLQPREHDDQNNTLNTESKVTINDQLLIRVNKAVDDDHNAEPTPEGIHQDATEISSVTLIGRDNIERDHGGESRIWTLDQPTGTYKSQSFGDIDVGDDSNSNEYALNGFSWDKCLFNKALESPWETILFNDRKVKHEVREFFSQDKNEPSYRDVIVNFVRKPLSSGDDVKMVNGKEESII